MVWCWQAQTKQRAFPPASIRLRQSVELDPVGSLLDFYTPSVKVYMYKLHHVIAHATSSSRVYLLGRRYIISCFESFCCGSRRAPNLAKRHANLQTKLDQSIYSSGPPNRRNVYSPGGHHSRRTDGSEAGCKTYSAYAVTIGGMLW